MTDTKQKQEVDALAGQSIEILRIQQELNSVKSLLMANNNTKELEEMRRKLSMWRVSCIVVSVCCVLLFLLAI